MNAWIRAAQGVIYAKNLPTSHVSGALLISALKSNRQYKLQTFKNALCKDRLNASFLKHHTPHIRATWSRLLSTSVHLSPRCILVPDTRTRTQQWRQMCTVCVQPSPTDSRLRVGYWLLVCCAFICSIVIVGGITRLTESGLSITEWRPVTGTIPPLSDQEWAVEFEKYKNSPEFKKLHADMTLDEFKKIFYWEWTHRFLSRALGLVFGIPLVYFVSKRHISKSLSLKLFGFLALGGLQGALGWYMVKSGLQVQDDQIPRVSAYRLCAHLSTALFIYLGLLWTSLDLLKPRTPTILPPPTWLRSASGALVALIFLTSMSGALVAGLDAGLVYNEFPYMGDQLVPMEYWKLKPFWKNFFENDATAQFNHRVLGITTFLSSNLLFLLSRKQPLNPSTRYAINSIAAASWIQASLGLATLLYFVPIPLAAAHQTGSLVLLTLSTWLLHTTAKKPPL